MYSGRQRLLFFLWTGKSVLFDERNVCDIKCILNRSIDLDISQFLSISSSASYLSDWGRKKVVPNLFGLWLLRTKKSLLVNASLSTSCGHFLVHHVSSVWRLTEICVWYVILTTTAVRLFLFDLVSQVSHHPPISACHCESKNFTFWQGRLHT